MRIAGGVLAIVVGAIQTITSAIAVLFTSAVESVVTTVAVDAEDEEGAETLAEVVEVAGAASVWGWVYLILALLILVFGIVVCASRSAMNGLVLLGLGVVMVALALLFYSGIIGLLWAGLSLLAGILAYLGMRQPQPATA